MTRHTKTHRRRRTHGGRTWFEWAKGMPAAPPAAQPPAQLAKAVAPVAAPVNYVVEKVSGVVPGGVAADGKPLLGGRKRKTRRHRKRHSRKH